MVDDIKKLANLIQTAPTGIKGIANENTLLSVSGLDQVTNLPLKTTWNVIRPVSSSLIFEAKLLSYTLFNQIELEFIVTDEIQPRVIIQSKDISLGDFTVPSNGVLILKNLPLISLSELKITVTDRFLNIKSVTLSGQAYQVPTFFNHRLNTRKEDLRLMLLDLERFDEVISKIVSIGQDHLKSEQ